jgi:demethylmenaquinone methyltransferase/2-methoxy-6-polyprenyl-1,4-benzoquinol methylase
LEFSHIENPVMAKLYDAYSFNVIPKVGGLVAGDEDSYKYLVESIRKFPAAAEFESMIAAAGFVNVKHKKLSQGVVAIHSGVK